MTDASRKLKAVCSSGSIVQMLLAGGIICTDRIVGYATVELFNTGIGYDRIPEGYRVVERSGSEARDSLLSGFRPLTP